MNIKTTLIAGITAISMLFTESATAQVSDREAAAIALGAAAIIAGAAIASQHRGHERYHHHYHHVPHPAYPPPLRYRYYEPMPAPSPYYHHPYRRHWQ
jgi:hypothetical protein